MSIPTVVLLLSLATASYCYESRILGGTIAGQGEFPYLASVEVKNTHTCSGFIYNNNWIVTVASCVDEVLVADLTVTVGQLSLIYEDVGEETFPVRKVIIHPDFNSTTLKNNLALLEVGREITFGAFAQCILYDLVDELSPNHANGTIMGWGLTSENGLPSTILRKDDEMVIPGDCRPYGISLFDKNLMVCAGDDFNSPCQHDEGSPLIQNSAVVGIFSFNRGCGINQIASVFTNVLAYFDWLIREAGSQPSTCIKNQPFVCPTDTGSYPIWPSACTSQHYVCINGVPVLDKCDGDWLFDPSVQSCLPPQVAPCNNPMHLL